MGFERSYIAAAVEHVAHPAAVLQATGDVDRSDQPAVIAKLVHVLAHGMLMRHGDDQSVAVAQTLEAGDGSVETGGVHFRRHHDRIDTAFGEQGIEALGRTDAGKRVAEYGVEAGSSSYRHGILVAQLLGYRSIISSLVPSCTTSPFWFFTLNASVTIPRSVRLVSRLVAISISAWMRSPM